MVKYIFKLTPNNKEVIINSSVLLNGYPDVNYPIKFINTNQLGYVIDTDTFKFDDPSTLTNIDKPYPIKLEIEYIQVKEYVRFYGINKKVSTDKIIYTTPIWDNNGCKGKVTYDLCTLKYQTINVQGYNIEYDIIFRIYWSDNKSHYDNWSNIDSEGHTGVEPLIINLHVNKLLKSIVINGEDSKQIIFKDNLTENSSWLIIPDNTTYSTINLFNLTINATFTDPETGISVSQSLIKTIQQEAHVEPRLGYVLGSFILCKPMEVWSPTVQTFYTQSNKDEANVYVNKKLNTEYAGFVINSSITYDKQNFQIPYYRKNIINSQVTYYTTNSSLHKTTISKNNFQNVYNNIFNNSSLNLRKINIKNNTNISQIYDISINNFYIYDDSSFLELNASVFQDIDYINFKNRIKDCVDCAIDTSIQDLFNVPKITVQYMNTPLLSAENEERNYYITDIPIHKYTIDVSAQYNARYAKYLLDTDGNYKQVIGKNSSIDIELSNNITTDFSKYIINTSDNISSNILNTFVNYTTTIDETGKVIQFKYCVNNLLEDDGINSSTEVQVPRFGVYPVYKFCEPILTDIYNFESNDIPFEDLKNDNNPIILDNTVIAQINNRLDELNASTITPSTNSNSEDSNSNTTTIHHITDIPSNAIITDMQGSYTIAEQNALHMQANNMLYSANNSEIFKLTLSDIPDEFKDKIRINGVLTTSLENDVEPYIFTLSVDEFPENYNSVSFKGMLNNTEIKILLTNDENEKHLTNYVNKGQDIDTELDSFMLLRTNPKLTGNIKLVVDTDYKLYLDTFKASPKLNDQRYRKQAISATGNYPYDVKQVFNSLPDTEIFKIPENSLKAHKVYTDFNDQYETMYEYGAETNKDNLYNENMKILAPLHIGRDVPDFFTIFRYDDIIDNTTFKGEQLKDKDKFFDLLQNSTVIKTYDLRQYTSIGQYLNNYKDMLTNYGQCYLQFIEQDNNINSPSYRQGTNIWKGVSINRGILTDQSETSYFAAKILNSNIPNKQELFNNFIIQGFERHKMLYPNIINLEYMFNDDSQEEYSMHRYFGLYLTENDFIKYGYVIPDETNNNVYKKYDTDGNIYVGDHNIYTKIFNGKYNDRLFYAVTNTDTNRVKSEKDINNFLTDFVKNKPDKNVISIKSDKIDFKKSDKSFITLHFSESLKYGEHIKIIALNKPKHDNQDTFNNLPYEHIVFEIIASNDERLIDVEDNINPYVNEQDCIYSENTYFYRLSFYSQDIVYNNIPAPLSVQIERIVKCIEKFNTFIHVPSYNNNSISIVSEYDEMYLQHIDAPNVDEFKYDYLYFENINSSIYTTNKTTYNSIDYFTKIDNTKVDIYTQVNDDENDWLTDNSTGILKENQYWTLYVESEDQSNIKEDTISYFNKDIKYNMYALTNQSNYFDGYYAAFSNYCFETLGWRYNTIVKFIRISDLNNSYNIYDDNVYDYIKNIKFPIVMTDDNYYETINMFNIQSGYLRNNIIDPDIYEAYTSKQQFIFNNKDLSIITTPYNVDNDMLCTTGDALLKNNMIQLYHPKSVNIAIMGINNVKDIDTVIDLNQVIHNETNLNIIIEKGENIKIDESDYRIQHGVMYEIKSGTLIADNSHIIDSGTKFIIIQDKVTKHSLDGGEQEAQINPGRFNAPRHGGIQIPDDYPIDNIHNYDYYLTYDFKIYTNEGSYNCNSITAVSRTELKLIDRQCYQEYNYDTKVPMIKSDNLFRLPEDTDNSELLYPIVPLTNCNWISNGQYLDHNSILDVNNLNYTYETQGHFVENVYTPSNYTTNQYVTNKVDSIVFVNNKSQLFKDAILHNTVQHPIKKLLIDNVNIKPAMVYYNSNIQSLEFIFSGIKFNIKLNSKLVNTYIHLEDYNNYEVFVLNDYNLSKHNELYISQIERFILLVNHEFYINYQYEAVSNIKSVDKDNFKAYTDYSAFKAPYSIDFRTLYIDDNFVITNKKDVNYNKSLINSIDKHNLWSTLFAQFDKGIYQEEPQFIQANIIGINNYDRYVNIESEKTTYGILNDNKVSMLAEYDKTNNETISYPYIITKADGDYNHQAYKLLTSINAEVNTILSTMTDTNVSDVNISKQDIIDTKEHIDLDEETLALTIDTDNSTFNKLSQLLNTPYCSLIVNDKSSLNYNNYILPKEELQLLQEYINKILVYETPKEKQERYIKSFSNNIDVYIIPVNAPIRIINNTDMYNPLIFTLSIPSHIKYNHGWFTPNTINMIKFNVDDELKDVLNLDLLQSNTQVVDINNIKNYTGNKVFDDSHLQNLKHNYFLIPERSLLSTTWDNDYYRKYISEDSYEVKEGHITGIDDKSFFGSRCMVIKEPYLTLDTWSFITANDILSTEVTDDSFNVNSTNIKSLKITINLTSAIYNHFFNNKVFADNWISFKNTQHTGMKNYINNTLLTYYNLNSNIEVIIYKKDIQQTESINILTEKPVNLDTEYSIYEGINVSAPVLKDDFYTLTVTIPQITGMNIYPIIKIHRK